MNLADYQEVLPKDHDTALKINISWHYFFPACSTTPWQLEGVIRSMLQDGYIRELLHGCHNRTVVVSAKRGEIANKHRMVVEKYRLRNIHLYENEPWIRYEPKGKMLVLPEIFPDGIMIPKRMIGENICHLPTIKTHVFTTTTGAMKNAFGGLLDNKRHYCHSKIHETLADLLAIQKEIHSGIFTVTDGTTAGNGAGPRTMLPVEKNILLASSDSVAIDAVSAKLMGFEPMDHAFIRTAHERGLGTGRFSEIEIVGDIDAAKQSWGFATGNNAASCVGKLFWFGPFKWLEELMFHTPLVYIFIMASAIYHDRIWYPSKGKDIVNKWLKENRWGKLFAEYQPGGIKR